MPLFQAFTSYFSGYFRYIRNIHMIAFFLLKSVYFLLSLNAIEIMSLSKLSTSSFGAKAPIIESAKLWLTSLFPTKSYFIELEIVL